MASYMKRYGIRKNKLERSLLEGFVLTEDGALETQAEQPRHTMFLSHIDSGEADCGWGRLSFSARLGEDMVLIVRAFASNELSFVANDALTSVDGFLLDPQIPLEHKQKLFVAADAVKVTGSRDLLLYGQTGRYLWIYVELLGAGRTVLSDFQIINPGDNFLQTFPEIYRQNEFLHRYLSIFSSLYNDLQDTIDAFDRLLDIDTAPAGLLPVFQEWLGIELDGDFLEEKYLRRLLKEAFSLIQVKGTRAAVEKIVGIFVEEPFYIVEQRQVLEPAVGRDRAVGEALYGESPLGYTVLLARQADEKLHARLMLLLRQFSPLRCRISIVFLGENISVDSWCYMDVNACIIQPQPGRTDLRAGLTGITYLQ